MLTWTEGSFHKADANLAVSRGITNVIALCLREGMQKALCSVLYLLTVLNR